METTELGTDNQEHTVQGLGVFVLWQEVRLQAEAESHLGRGEEVGLEDGGVEHTEGGHNHLIMLIDSGATDQLLQLGAVEDLVDLET